MRLEQDRQLSPTLNVRNLAMSQRELLARRGRKNEPAAREGTFGEVRDRDGVERMV